MGRAPFAPSAAHRAGSGRFHELDSLRGSMMLLGVALHSAVAYMQTPLGELWAFKDAGTSPLFDVAVAFVHTFRVPVFFVMAGFFAALLHERRGPREMIANRTRRVLVPLVLGWIVLFPVTVAGFVFAQLGGDAAAAAAAMRYVVSPAVLEHVQWMHLWFLFDLLVYYAAAMLLVRLLERVPPRFPTLIVGVFGWLLRRWYAPLAPAMLTVMALVPMASGMLETPGTFQRPVATLAADGLFFGFGWLLFLRRDLLPAFVPHAWRRTLAACAIFPLHALALVRLADRPDLAMHLLAIGTVALMAWLLVFGLTGLCTRYLAGPSPLRRYLSDASYWFYLIHLPLVAWGAGLLSRTAWPPGVKYVALFGAVTLVCWVTYELAVRSTVLGVVLNGRRYPRMLVVGGRGSLRRPRSQPRSGRRAAVAAAPGPLAPPGG